MCDLWTKSMKRYFISFSRRKVKANTKNQPFIFLHIITQVLYIHSVSYLGFVLHSLYLTAYHVASLRLIFIRFFFLPGDMQWNKKNPTEYLDAIIMYLSSWINRISYIFWIIFILRNFNWFFYLFFLSEFIVLVLYSFFLTYWYLKSIFIDILEHFIDILWFINR